ncbi:voltage-gated purine nucleotide uniporter SLC17A9-like, partial [Saccoglossus kowalevskii]
MDTRATNAVLTHDNDHITYAPNNPLLDVEHEDQDNENDVHYWTRREMSVNVPSLIVLTVLAYACRNITAISIVSQASEYNWDKSQMGLVLSCFYIGYVSTQIISGFLSDYIGGNQVITLAAIGWGITTIVYPYCVDVSRDQSTQLAIIVVIRTIFAILQGFHYPAVANVVASKIHIRNRTCIYTCFAAGSSIGW